MAELTQETVFKWIKQAIDDTVGIAVTKTTQVKTVLAACKQFEDDTGHKGKMSKALHFAISQEAWKPEMVYYRRFELVDLRQGPKGPDGTRAPFGTCTQLARYLRDNAAQVTV